MANVGFCELCLTGNIKIHNDTLIIKNHFRTPRKCGIKFHSPMKMLHDILVPPLTHSALESGIKNDRCLKV